MHPSLYTPTDVKTTRKALYDKQQGVDPILKEKVPYVDSVCDHDHVTQHCRAALHRQSNAFEGLVFNAYRRCLQWVTDKPLPEVLRNLADYLEQDYSNNPYHTGWIKRVTTDFSSLKSKDQDAVLVSLGQGCGKNATDRKKKFSEALKTRQYGYAIIKELLSKGGKP